MCELPYISCWVVLALPQSEQFNKYYSRFMGALTNFVHANNFSGFA